MSEQNVEVVRRLFPGTVDLVAGLADPAGFEPWRVVFEPLVHPEFETVTVPRQVPLSGAGAEDPSRPIFWVWTDSLAPSVTGSAPGRVGW